MARRSVRDREHRIDHVLASIRRIVRALRVSSRDAERRLGVSGAQLFVLHEIGRAPPRSMAELAARTHTDQSSVSVVVDRLVSAGLVERRPGQKDRRRTELSITPRGRRLVQRAPEPVQARLVSGLLGLSERELDSVLRGLETLVSTMDATREPAELFFEEPERR